MITVSARLPSSQSSERLPPWRSIQLSHPEIIPPDFWEYGDHTQRYLDIHGVDACLKQFWILRGSKCVLELGLVGVLVSQLRGKLPGTLDNIYRMASKHNLNCCPVGTGLQLRHTYNDQPLNERLVVAMNPIKTPFDTDPIIFGLSHDSRGMVLSYRNASLGTVYPDSTCFIFSTGPVVR